MVEYLKSLNIAPKVLAKKSNAMWDILLVKKEARNLILTTKSVRLQAGYLGIYLGIHKTKITLHVGALRHI